MRGVLQAIFGIGFLTNLISPIDSLVIGYTACYGGKIFVIVFRILACMSLCIGGAGISGATVTVSTGGAAAAAFPVAVPTAVAACASTCAGLCLPAVATPV